VSSFDAEAVSVTVDDAVRVSGLLQAPPRARACYVLAHGAGAGMAHPFMAAVAAELGERGMATWRYQCPYMEQGGRRPDPPKLAHATVRAAAIRRAGSAMTGNRAQAATAFAREAAASIAVAAATRRARMTSSSTNKRATA